MNELQRDQGTHSMCHLRWFPPYGLTTNQRKAWSSKLPLLDGITQPRQIETPEMVSYFRIYQVSLLIFQLFPLTLALTVSFPF